MAIALVGQAGIAGGDQITPMVINYNSTRGNTLILTGFLYYGTPSVPGISTITDSAGNTWHYSTSANQDPPYNLDIDNGNSLEFVAWCINAAAVSSVTITMPNASPWTRIALSEWSGIAAYDTSATANANTGTSASATLTLSTAGDLVVGACENNSGTANISIPSGWAEFPSAGATNVAYGIAGSAGSYSPAFTLSTSSDWGVAFAAFKPAPTSGITFVQNASQAAPVNPANTLTINLITTPGDTLVAVGRIYCSPGGTTPGYPTAITDSAGNTWQFATTTQSGPPPGRDFTGAGLYSACWVAYCLNARGIASVTFTAPAVETTYIEANLSEWSGIGSVGVSGTVANLGGAEIVSPALYVGAGDLMIGMQYPESGSSPLPQPTTYSGTTSLGSPSALANSGDNVWWPVFQKFTAAYPSVHWDWNGAAPSIAVAMTFHAQGYNASSPGAFMQFFP